MPMSRRRRIEFSISVKIQDVEYPGRNVELASFAASRAAEDHGFIEGPRGFVESSQTLNAAVQGLIAEYLEVFLEQEKKAGH
jgi:hypothetical protein